LRGPDALLAEVATMHGRGVYWERFRAAGVPVHSLSPHKFVPLYVWNLLRLLLTGEYDIVHCHLIASNLIAKPLAALLGVPVRFNHDQANDEYRYRNRGRLILDALANRLSTHICAVSASIVEFLKEREHVPAERISLVHNAIDLCRFTPGPERRVARRTEWGLPPDALVIAGIGRLNYQKNFEIFIDIAKEVRRTHPQAVFVIAGSGPEERALRERQGTPCVSSDSWPTPFRSMKPSISCSSPHASRVCRWFCSRPWPCACQRWPRASTASPKSSRMARMVC
jgi:glycosyltransferase involved in cell wall biosynthesis